MTGKVIVTGFLLVVMASMLVFITEFFIPLSSKIDFNTACRSVLLKMENEGGLSGELKAQLVDRLEGLGFKNVTVDGDEYVRQGEPVNLHVEAEYTYSKLTSLFSRSGDSQIMNYDKTAMSRRVIN